MKNDEAFNRRLAEEKRRKQAQAKAAKARREAKK